MNDLKMPAPVLNAPAYDEDLAAWTERQVALLRERRFEQLDLENLIDELEGLVRKDRRELCNRIEVLLIHLLKCQFQPARTSRSWLSTLHEQRNQVDDLLDESPSLRGSLERCLLIGYPRAVKRAMVETGLERTVFPTEIPYSLADILDEDFIP